MSALSSANTVVSLDELANHLTFMQVQTLNLYPLFPSLPTYTNYKSVLPFGQYCVIFLRSFLIHAY